MISFWGSHYDVEVWTIFEQFMAIKLRIPVRIIMPSEAQRGLMEQIGRGNEGLNRLCDSLGTVDSEKAEASNPKDSAKVKHLIRNSVGSFKGVDAQVRAFMLDWVGKAVINHLDGIINTRKVSDSHKVTSL